VGSSKRIYKFYCQSRPTLTTTAETNRHQKTISGNPVCNAMFAIRIGEDAVNGKGSVRISTLVRGLRREAAAVGARVGNKASQLPLP
jgi:hypothetical protein